MDKLAIIHTTAVTIEPLGALAAEMLPGWQVINFLDDSILPQLRESGGHPQRLLVGGRADAPRPGAGCRAGGAH